MKNMRAVNNSGVVCALAATKTHDRIAGNNMIRDH